MKSLIEERKRMQEIMGFTYKDNSHDILSEEFIKRSLIKEQQTEEPELFDWTNGGKYTWENAKIKSIVKYVESVDTYFNAPYKDNEIYQSMLAWFESNDSTETRKSLKSWLFGDIYYGVPQSSDNQKKKSPSTEENGFDRDLNNKLKDVFVTAIEVANKVNDPNIKTSITKLNTELLEMQKNNILISKDEIMDILYLIEPFIVVNNNSYEPINPDVEKPIDEKRKEKIYKKIKDRYKDVKRNLRDTKSAGLKVRIDSDDDVLVTVKPEEAIQYRKNVLTELIDVINTGKVAEKNITDISKMFGYVNEIEIFNDASGSVAGWEKDVKTEKIPRMVTGEIPVVQYPANPETEKGTEEARDMFPDDGDQLSDKARKAIQLIMKEIRDMINEKEAEVEELRKQHPKIAKDLNIEILSLDLYAYSSTSKVRTAYGSNSKNYSEANNVALAEARINTMKNAAISGAKRYLDGYVDDINDILSQTRPNVGPGWSKLDGVYANGKPVPLDNDSYGKMFMDAYKRYEKSTGKKLTPRQFFGNRSKKSATLASKLAGYKISQQELVGEYENVYSPYRMASFGIGVTLRMPDVFIIDSESENFIVAVTPNLGINIDVDTSFDWKSWGRSTGRKIKKFFRKFKLKPRRPKGKVIDFSKVCKDCCPKF